jgi:hypothetical protein
VFERLIICDGIPKRIVVSLAFGFIVVQFENCLRVFLRTGELVREIGVDFEIECWTTFESRSGFDYLLIGDSIGGLRVVEIFEGEIKAIYKGQSRVIEVKYGANIDGILAISQDGRLCYIPYIVE